jgi:phenylalanyl-tRNA synthetase beta chain
MKVSHSSLQEYFKDPIPPAETLAELFTFHAFEVEGLEKIGNDSILDVKILPDRAHYALSHRGIAREISFITGLPLDDLRLAVPEIEFEPSRILELDIESDLCRRDSKIIIEHIDNDQSPAWLKEKLETLGQRAINFIVDVTNYVMLDVGQPIHAFDLDKLTKKNGKVKIVLKAAHRGEKITILGGKELMLDEGVLIFADAHNHDLPLDIAGIKGGTAAEIDQSTKNIVVLAANFDSSYIRKTSTSLGIRTDASKRSENGIPLKLTLDGLQKVAELILKHSPHATIEGLVDFYPIPEDLPQAVETTMKEISELLGIHLKEETFEQLLAKLDLRFEKDHTHYIVTPPYYRNDIKTISDLVEEVGRMYGYDKIPATLLPRAEKAMPLNTVSYWIEKIKDLLVEAGYSEVSTYSLKDQGEVKIQNPLASDKGYLRDSLSLGIEQSLLLNSRNAALLGLEDIKIFEIGTVFLKHEEEHINLALGYFTTKSLKNKEKKIWEMLEQFVIELGHKIGTELKGIMKASDVGVVFEMNLSGLIEKLPHPATWDIQNPTTTTVFKPISPYPFIVRDIAVFVPEGISEQEVRDSIEKESGNLLVRYDLFDVFQKQFPNTKKTSYAFHLVFQSQEKTLTDDEINPIIHNITNNMNSKQGWEVR